MILYKNNLNCAHSIDKKHFKKKAFLLMMYLKGTFSKSNKFMCFCLFFLFCSLKKLAEECLQVLQTPARDHKRKSMSPGLSGYIPVLKTPQSILKVRRLSKTLPNSRGLDGMFCWFFLFFFSAWNLVKEEQSGNGLKLIVLNLRIKWRRKKKKKFNISLWSENSNPLFSSFM